MSNRSVFSLLRRAWKLLAIGLIAVTAVYYLRFRPTRVRLVDVKKGDVNHDVMGTGTLEARLQITLSSKIAGRITSVLVDQNDQVTKGQLLLTLDDSDLQREVKVAEEELAERKAGLIRAQAGLKRAEAILEQARLDHGRTSDLAKQKVIPGADRDESEKHLRVAAADVDYAKAAVVEAKSRIDAAQQALELKRARLADTRITSPFDGLVVSRDRDAGEILVPGTPVLSLASTKEIWVSAWVDETAISLLKPGQPARVVFRSMPETTYRGSVVRLARQVDRETREFVVDVRVIGLPEHWAIGQRTDVYIRVSNKREVTVVPNEAIRHRKGQTGVLVEENGRARWRSLVLGTRGSKNVEVVKGLASGAKVILDRPESGGQVREGMAVSP